MGTCQPNCCERSETNGNEKLIDINNNADPTFENLVVDEQEDMDDGSNIGESVFNKYDSTMINTAGSLYNPVIYENMLSGDKIESLVMKIISEMNNNNKLFYLLDYIFETMSNFSKLNEDQFSTTLSFSFKICMKKQFVELNEYGPIPRSATIRNLFCKCLINFVEIYHFFKYNQNQRNSRKNLYYLTNFWEEVPEAYSYIRMIFLSSVECLMKINSILKIGKVKGKDRSEYLDSKTHINLRYTLIFLNTVYKKIM